MKAQRWIALALALLFAAGLVFSAAGEEVREAVTASAPGSAETPAETDRTAPGAADPDPAPEQPGVPVIPAVIAFAVTVCVTFYVFRNKTGRRK